MHLINNIFEKCKWIFKWGKNHSPITKIKQKNKNIDNVYNNININKASLNPISSDLASDLEIMIEFLDYEGRRVPSLREKHCITLEMHAVEGEVSYAERSNQFFLIGKNAIKKCRELLQSELEDSVKQSVKKILEFLTEKEEGQKDKLGKMEMALLSGMRNHGFKCSEYAEELSFLKKELDNSL